MKVVVMPIRPLLTRSLLLITAFLALAVIILAPTVASAQEAYVSLHQGREILVLDPTDASNVANRISLPSRPTGLTVSPDGTTIYVLVDAIVRVVTKDPVSGAWQLQPEQGWLNGSPEQIALTPDGATLWIPNMSRQIWYTSTGNIPLTSPYIIPGNWRAFGIAMLTTPSGLPRAYVSLPDLNVVHVYDATATPSTSALVDTIALAAGTADPRGVVASPHGDRVYVASSSGHVSVINTDETLALTDRLVATVDVGDTPQNLTVNAEGSTVYVALPGAGAVATIDVDTTSDTYVFSAAIAISVDSDPSIDQVHGLSINDAGQLVVAHSGTHVVTAVDSGTLAIETSPTVGPSVPWTTTRPRYVAFKPLTPVAPPEPPADDNVEFAQFGLRRAKISTRGRFADSLWFNGNLTLDLENGDGINPPEEDVTVTIEGVEFAIPAGTFRSYWKGRLFKYRGKIGGARLLIYLIRHGRGGSGRYNINVSGWKAELEGAENPLRMCVTIGNDFGCAERKGWIR
jgi:DNA-binding beta-propeller fold protein YncE